MPGGGQKQKSKGNPAGKRSLTKRPKYEARYFTTRRNKIKDLERHCETHPNDLKMKKALNCLKNEVDTRAKGALKRFAK